MESSASMELGEVVGKIRDPRVPNRSDHLLVDIVGITRLAVLCGADDFVAGASFAWEPEFTARCAASGEGDSLALGYRKHPAREHGCHLR